MTTDRHAIEAACRTLGLAPGASVDAAKRAFRQRVKTLHPDRTPPTAETLAALSDAIAAMRTIESADVFEADLWISPEQARAGVTRLVSSGMRREFVRIPPGAADGQVLGAIGDGTARITVRIRPAGPATEARSGDVGAIERFVADFASPSPAARFARWARGPRSAA